MNTPMMMMMTTITTAENVKGEEGGVRVVVSVTEDLEVDQGVRKDKGVEEGIDTLGVWRGADDQGGAGEVIVAIETMEGIAGIDPVAVEMLVLVETILDQDPRHLFINIVEKRKVKIERMTAVDFHIPPRNM